MKKQKIKKKVNSKQTEPKKIPIQIHRNEIIFFHFDHLIQHNNHLSDLCHLIHS